MFFPCSYTHLHTHTSYRFIFCEFPHQFLFVYTVFIYLIFFFFTLQFNYSNQSKAPVTWCRISCPVTSRNKTSRPPDHPMILFASSSSFGIIFFYFFLLRSLFEPHPPPNKRGPSRPINTALSLRPGKAPQTFRPRKCNCAAGRISLCVYII